MKMRMWVMLGGALLVSAPPAFSQVNLGPQLSWADDFDLGIGGRVHFGLQDIHEQLEGAVSLDLFFPDDGFGGVEFNYFEINANALYRIDLEDTDAVVPYAGAGFNIARLSVDPGGGPFLGDGSDTEVGLNILGGARFPTDRLTPYGELRLELSGGEQIVLTAGVLFQIGGRS